MSGHSKWSQIKHKKSLTDAKKGQLFSKLVREIMVAARDGGPNPQTNARLRQAMERARSQGLPKDNVERAIDRASGAEEGAALQEFLYEAMAPGGVTIIIEGITDNKNRTLAEIKHLLNEHGSKLAESGSLSWGFDKIGWIEINKEDNPDKKQGEIELIFIDSGATDFKYSDGVWLVETNFTKLEKAKQKLERAGIKIKETGHDYKPRLPLDLGGGERSSVEKLLDELSEHSDVQEVYTNLKGLTQNNEASAEVILGTKPLPSTQF